MAFFEQSGIYVIPGEDPGSSVQRCPCQMLVAGHGSRIKSGMTDLKIRMTQATDVHQIGKLHWGVSLTQSVDQPRPT
jgi:hypothetical protein